MSRKKKRYSKPNQNVSLESIDYQANKLAIQKSMMLDNLLKSNDPDDIIKAQSYLKSIENKKDNSIKAFQFAPDSEYYQGNGYKMPVKRIPFDVLRGMGDIHIINSVITTRQEQLANFNSFTTDERKEGWTIKKKLSRFYDKEYDLTDKDKREIERIVDYLENGGVGTKWDNQDDLDDFFKKFDMDTLTLDQVCFEIERNRRGEVIGHFMTDSATMRLMETIDPAEVEKYGFKEINGYKPIYAQVWRDRIRKNQETNEPIVFYPWELSFAIRNKSSDIRRNGYGKSELEILSDIVTYILWGIQYNGNFFKQGSTPRGFFTIEGEADNNILNQFRSQWQRTMAGVVNSHKTPVFEGGKVNWVDMMTSNKDMEFQSWNEFLMLLTCSVYRIDPSELGYNFKNQSQIFGQDGQQARLEHSREKGLKPLLKFRQKQINKYLVSELNPDYEFVFTGVDLEDEQTQLENDIKLGAAGFTSLEDNFKKYSKREFDPEKDTILNQIWLQAKQAPQFGGEESNAAVDEMTGEPNEGVQNPFEQFGKSEENDPILSETQRYLNNLFKK